MAKHSLSYYPQDTNHVTHPKIKLLFLAYGANGFWVWECLKCYSQATNGYYLDINNEDYMRLFASDICKLDYDLVMAIIKECAKRNLINNEIYTKYGIVTSDRIQDNFINGTSDRRKKGAQINVIQEYICVDEGFNKAGFVIKKLNSQEKTENSKENLENSQEIASQIRIDNNKIKQNREKALEFLNWTEEEFKEQIRNSEIGKRMSDRDKLDFFEYYIEPDTKTGEMYFKTLPKFSLNRRLRTWWNRANDGYKHNKS